MRIPKAPGIVQSTFSKITWNIPVSEKKVFLTFDDGPTPDVTPKVLKILKNYNALATFFCVGNNVTKYPAIFRQILEEGHSVGNHTFHHINGWKYRNSSAYYKDILHANHYIQSPLFRPPYGKITPRQFRILRKQYQIVFWDILSYDFDNNISKYKCADNVIENAIPGSIIVFHDSYKAKNNMLYALPRVLETLTEQSYTFETIQSGRTKITNVTAQ